MVESREILARICRHSSMPFSMLGIRARGPEIYQRVYQDNSHREKATVVYK